MAGGLVVLVVVLAVVSAAGWGVRPRHGRVCAHRGPARDLTAVARSREGVTLIEIDAARRLDLARRLNVLSTPTIFMLRPDGSIARRASGRPRKPDVLAAVSGVLDGPPRGGGK